MRRSTREYLTNDETLAFLQAAMDRDARSHCMFLFALAHGARASEICNLKVSDINFYKNQVYVNRLKNSNKSLQNFLINENLLLNEKLAFEKWIEMKNFHNADMETMPYVFSLSPEPLTRQRIYALFKDVCLRAKLPNTKHHPHVLKHTLAMRLLENNATAAVIQKALGHKAISSTMTYLNPTDSQASQAIRKAFE